MQNPTPPPSRRTYRAPSIAQLGALVDLTAGPDGGAFDVPLGSSGGFGPGAPLDPS